MSREIFVDLIRSAGDLAGVFEYDGEAGYFYLYRTNTATGAKIVDAIWLASGEIDFTRDDLAVRWDSAETKVALFVHNVMWAVFDCRSGQKFGGNYKANGRPQIPANVTFIASQ